ncbi:MAG: dihydroorotate dehydrogenase [Spirochaetales bacterium]|nr:MAG: dihydroorotate dehydrogenase [Spirochaetales bacterium]
MANLKTTYMGIELKNPVIAGASELTSNINSIQKINEENAGALVIKSLFEEQIQLEIARFESEQNQYDNMGAEMGDLFPNMEHAGPEEHLMWIRKGKEASSIPVIASLNAVNRETWIDWAKRIEETGVDGLELNFFANPELQAEDGAAIEKDQIAVMKEVVKSVKIPVSVKMSPFYTSPVKVAKSFADAGAKALVLFNKFFQPDMDPDTEKHLIPLTLSTTEHSLLPLRYAGLLYGETSADICASSGIMEGKDAVKMLLAGADTVQVVSTLYRNKIAQLGKIVKDIEAWMDEKGYASLNDFRGKLSRKNTPDPWTYKRAQYAKLLMKPDPLSIIR